MELTTLFRQVQDAAERLAGNANITPVLTSRTLNQRIGAELYLKCENFQRVGAFKFRGAFNAMVQLSTAERERGVLTYSSGNHAQAVALVGRLLGIDTTIVMPDNAPAIKRAATEAYGAMVIDYDPEKATRQAIATELHDQKGLTLIPPFDHADVISGQGTATLELLHEVGALDWLLVPCGGGGLLSGAAIAAKGASKGCRVVGVEPEVADDAVRSFRTGKLHTVHNPPTIADGTRTASLGKLTFPLVLNYVDDMVTVTENAIMQAVRFLFYRMKIVVEPSGALGIAALLSGALKPEGKVGIILSGGNVDATTMIKILKSGQAQ
jgi:threonine dehydratase